MHRRAQLAVQAAADAGHEGHLVAELLLALRGCEVVRLFVCMRVCGACVCVSWWGRGAGHEGHLVPELLLALEGACVRCF